MLLKNPYFYSYLLELNAKEQHKSGNEYVYSLFLESPDLSFAFPIKLC
jgi:hypothetical protein